MVNPLLTGASAVRANQAGLDVVAHNIANASTPGFHRQRVRLSSAVPVTGEGGLLYGLGVSVDGVEQLRDQFLELAVLQNTSEQSATDAELRIVRQIESLLIPDEGSVSARLQDFFASLERLSASPTDPGVQQTTVRQAQSLTSSFNRLASDLHEIASGLRNEINDSVNSVNDLVERLSELNRQLRSNSIDTGQRAALQDRRDQVVAEISGLIDLKLRTEEQGRTVVLLGNETALIGEHPALFEVENRGGTLALVQPGPDTDIDVGGGKIAGLLEAHNRIVPRFIERLDELARGVIEIVDSVHSEGLGGSGPVQQVIGLREISNIDVPLSEAGLDLPIEAGRLYITVTDTATGEARREYINIDPDTQSLRDVVANLDQLPNVSINASVIGEPAKIRIGADSGHRIDFSGRADFTLTTVPTFTGSSTVQFRGRFSGDSNSTLRLSLRNSGTVGVTPDLAIDVYDESGGIVTTLNIGEGYEAGTDIVIADGVHVSFGSGLVNQGDSVSIDLVGDPDETGFLAALGLNALFSGTSASDIAVSEQIALDPAQLASSSNGKNGDTTNLLRLIDRINNGSIGETGLTPVQLLGQIVSDSGHHVNDLETVSNHLQAYGTTLAADQQSLSGVNPDEELLRLLQFQRGYQAAAQLISTVERALDDLFLILR